jgi:hypothetical protein
VISRMMSCLDDSDALTLLSVMLFERGSASLLAQARPRAGSLHRGDTRAAVKLVPVHREVEAPAPSTNPPPPPTGGVRSGGAPVMSGSSHR